MWTLEFARQCISDLDEIETYFISEVGDRELADRFEIATDYSFQKIAQMPWIGTALSVRTSELQGLRRYIVDGFPNHLIYYLPRGEKLVVLRIVHGARDLPSLIEIDES